MSFPGKHGVSVARGIYTWTDSQHRQLEIWVRALGHRVVRLKTYIWGFGNQCFKSII